MPAAYLRAPGYNGGARPICRKAGYESRRLAQRALKSLNLPGMGGLRIYKCPICVETWHHGHPPRTRQERNR